MCENTLSCSLQCVSLFFTFLFKQIYGGLSVLHTVFVRLTVTSQNSLHNACCADI